MAKKRGCFFYVKALIVVVLLIVGGGVCLSGDSEKGLRLMGLAAGGAFLLWLSGRTAAGAKDEKRKFMQCTAEWTGVVVDVKREEHTSTDDDGDTDRWYTYTPIIQYNVNGYMYQGKANISESKNVFQIGAVYQILVNPANFNEFVVKGTRWTAGAAMGYGLLRILFLLLGLGCLVYYFVTLTGVSL